MRHVFKCKVCGEYDVSEETFKSFLTPELNVKLANKAARAFSATFAFTGGGCPKCIPSSYKTIGKLSILVLK